MGTKLGMKLLYLSNCTPMPRHRYQMYKCLKQSNSFTLLRSCYLDGLRLAHQEHFWTTFHISTPISLSLARAGAGDVPAVCEPFCIGQLALVISTMYLGLVHNLKDVRVNDLQDLHFRA